MSAVMVERAVIVERVWSAAAVVVSGLAVGILTQILQGVLPDGWGVLANSGVMWALMAFALGAVLPTLRWAAAGGAVQLVIASIVYYMAVEWFEGSSSDTRGAIIWSAAGITAGSVFGIAGHVLVQRTEWRHPALALVAGVLAGEGIHLTWFVDNPDLRRAGITEGVIAAVLAIVCLTGAVRSTLRWSPTIVAGITLFAGAATLAAGNVIDAAFSAS